MNKNVVSFINRIKKDKKLIIIMALGFAGMVLLLLSSLIPDKTEVTVNERSDIGSVEQRIEKQLTELLKSVDGVGKVKVMVTLESLEERIVAQNSESESDQDATDEKNEYVLIESSGNTDGLTLKIITPVVRGVAISCEGAVSNAMRQEITKLVCAGLGISANKVWVTKMQE